jgi:ubiquitin C-terminal hydrolase
MEETNHHLEVAGSICDWCAEVCDSTSQELNALSCTFADCSHVPSVYHQDCIERYLKGIKLEK